MHNHFFIQNCLRSDHDESEINHQQRYSQHDLESCSLLQEQIFHKLNFLAVEQPDALDSLVRALGQVCDRGHTEFKVRPEPLKIGSSTSLVNANHHGGFPLRREQHLKLACPRPFEPAMS